MNLAEQLVKAERDLDNIRRQIAQCDHDYDGVPVVYDPEIKRVPTSYKNVAQGSDFWSEPQSYGDQETPRWSQACKKCGCKRYTTKTVPTGQKPVF